jgi:drug/metabolite transporter (DMT)-like permease
LAFRSTQSLAVLGLLLNAMAWGLAWWPFKQLQSAGLHPLWATAIMYSLAVLGIVFASPSSWKGLITVPAMWLLALGAGLTNIGFNWAVTIGDVVRVVLLFYLMPAWSILLAWLILDERPSRKSLARVALALAGVVLVLKTPESAWPVPSSLADWLALMGGFCFALNNSMLRKLREVPAGQRTFGMFLGGVLFSTCVALVGSWQSSISWPIGLGFNDWALLLGFALFFLLTNLTLQYGAARLKASTTSLIMLNEILFATASSVLLGASQLAPRIVLGGALIIAAALWAAWDERG